MGILICGLNGTGKSTLGRILADRLGYEFIDNEDLFFPKADPSYETDHIRQNCGVALNKTEGILIWRKKFIE